MGPERGTLVKLRGRRFSAVRSAPSMVYCATSVLSSTLLECAIPPLTPGAYYLAASNDGVQFAECRTVIQGVYSLERVTRVIPRRARGGSTISVRGANFVNTSLTRCRFGDQDVEASYVNATAIVYRTARRRQHYRIGSVERRGLCW